MSTYDIVIKAGTIIDGLRTPRFKADVAIKDGKIAMIGSVDASEGAEVVDASGKIVYGDRSIQPFSELWTFQRSVGVASTARAGTLESTCPGCGAPVALTQIGECRYCKAAVTSGKFDWVVSRIEQEDGIDGGDFAEQVTGAIVQGLINSVRERATPSR